MNDTLRTSFTLILASAGSFLAGVTLASDECVPGHLCSLAVIEQVHAHEREPALVLARQLINQVSTSTASGTFHMVVP
jgi:hypothetical protein